MIDLHRAQLSERLARLPEALVDGLLSKEAFEERNRTLLLERRGLDDRREALSTGRADDRAYELLEFIHAAPLSYENASTLGKRQLTEMLFSNRDLIPNGLFVEQSFPFRLIAKRAAALDGCPPRDTNRSLSSVPSEIIVYLLRQLKRLIERNRLCTLFG